MPSTYAHYRLGQEVADSILGDEKKIIEENMDLFNIGLHGPDILFYYHPLKSNEINSVGYKMHEKPGKDFFSKAETVIKRKGDVSAHLAYVYGFICHFALDATCHKYIDEKIAESGVSHAEIEVEFDRELMVRDGLNPIKQNLTNHIVVDDKYAGIIKDFFVSITSAQVKVALEGMVKYNHLLVAPSRGKRAMIYTLLRLTGNYKEMHGLMVNYEKNPMCKDSTKKLTELYVTARQRAIQMIGDYKNYEAEPLEDLYNYTFGGRLIEESTN